MCGLWRGLLQLAAHGAGFVSPQSDGGGGDCGSRRPHHRRGMAPALAARTPRSMRWTRFRKPTGGFCGKAPFMSRLSLRPTMARHRHAQPCLPDAASGASSWPAATRTLKSPEGASPCSARRDAKWRRVCLKKRRGGSTGVSRRRRPKGVRGYSSVGRKPPTASSEGLTLAGIRSPSGCRRPPGACGCTGAGHGRRHRGWLRTALSTVRLLPSAFGRGAYAAQGGGRPPGTC